MKQITFSYKQNGEWKKVSKIFEDEREMKQKIKGFLENRNLTEQRYWIEIIKAINNENSQNKY
jgi:hypothetical protein